MKKLLLMFVSILCSLVSMAAVTTVTWNYTCVTEKSSDDVTLKSGGLDLNVVNNAGGSSDYVNNAKTEFLHWNGTSSSSIRYAKFTAPKAGTVAVKFRSNNSSATDRIIAVGKAVVTGKDVDELLKDSKVYAADYTNGSTVITISGEVESGLVYIYAANGGCNISEITYTYDDGNGGETGPTLSNVATLSSLKIAGVEVDGFSASKKSYDYVVDATAFALPEVTYTTTDSKATAKYTAAGAISGSSTVVVTAENGVATTTYTINFKFADWNDSSNKYAIAKDQAIVGGEEVTTNIDGVSLVIGATETENKWKNGNANAYVNIFTASTDGNGSNPTLTNKVPTAGTFYKFIVTKNGLINAGIILNSGKDVYVVDGDGNEVFHVKSGVKVYKLLPFEVQAGKEYYLYATGTKLGFYGFTFEPIAANGVTVEIDPEIGYATFYDSEHAVKVPAGVTPYVFGMIDDEVTYEMTLGLCEYSEALSLEGLSYDGVIPAGEPVVLQGAGDVVLSYAEATNAAGNALNYLLGTDEAATTTNNFGMDCYYYALTLNAVKDPNSVGFYWMNKNGAAFTNKAHKAYLALPTSMPGAGMYAKKAYLFNKDATAIKNVDSSANSAMGQMFNIAGQRVNGSAKGIIIKNGKKMLVK